MLGNWYLLIIKEITVWMFSIFSKAFTENECVKNGREQLQLEKDNW